MVVVPVSLPTEILAPSTSTPFTSVLVVPAMVTEPVPVTFSPLTSTSLPVIATDTPSASVPVESTEISVRLTVVPVTAILPVASSVVSLSSVLVIVVVPVSLPTVILAPSTSTPAIFVAEAPEIVALPFLAVTFPPFILTDPFVARISIFPCCETRDVSCVISTASPSVPVPLIVIFSFAVILVEPGDAKYLYRFTVVD